MPRREDLGYLLIGQPELSSQVSRALATKGEQPSLIESRYQLGIQSLDLAAEEWAWLARNPLFEIGAGVGAVAAQFSYFIFAATSTAQRMLAIIESFTVSVQAASLISWQVVTYPGSIIAPTQPGTARDDRANSNTNPARPVYGSQFATEVALLTTVNSPQVSLGAGASFTCPVKHVLSINPSLVGAANQHALLIENRTANVPMTVSLSWRERQPLASEL